MRSLDDSPTLEEVRVAAYTVPTENPESDGTLSWDSTTVVVVEISASGTWGIGYTYSDESAADLVRRTLGPAAMGQSAYAPEAVTMRLYDQARNFGGQGVTSQAISAIDLALWDLKAKLLDLPLVELVGSVRRRVTAYGSGGFTSYDDRHLAEHLRNYVDEGLTRVMMKIGRHPNADARRVEVARDAIGTDAELFVDASGAYGTKQALELADVLYDYGVTWFEEPVPADDLAGLSLLRERCPPGMDIAAGSHGHCPAYFHRFIDAHAVDALAADATRCLGVTGFRKAAALAEASFVPLSAHGAPAVHVHLACASLPVVHVEQPHDHARIESLLFDGAPRVVEGKLEPDRTRPGLGLELRRSDAERYAA